MKPILQITAVIFVLVLSMIAAGAEQITTIRQVDFKNFTYPWSDPPKSVPLTWHWLTDTPKLYFPAAGGTYRFAHSCPDNSKRDHAPVIRVASITYGDLDGDGIEEAIVALNYSTGGTANWDYLYVYKLDNGKAVLLSRMETGSRGSGGLIKVSVRDGLLIIDFADPARQVGDCCSEGYIRVHYRWRDGHFAEEGAREHGDLQLPGGPGRVVSPSDSHGARDKASSEMQFSDQPDFAVAGVTDWTAAGGHGSDVNLRASEALAKETRKLESSSAAPSTARVADLQSRRDQLKQMLASLDRADLHRQLGDVDEQLNDPLAAVHEYERAAQLEASEENNFAWATELLLHRAISPALEVFTKGATKYPASERMLVGLGAALYASGLYAQAADRVCAAADLNPHDPTPYLFLGRMVQVSTQPLPCSEAKLERFSRDQPQNAAANYFYALALWKPARNPEKAVTDHIEGLLNKSITLDPKFAEAYLQLGIVYSSRDETAQALHSYQQAITANPNYAEAHFRLAQAYKKAGDSVESRQEFQAYEAIQKNEAAAVEQQRREIQQFVIVFKDQSQTIPARPEP